VRAGIIGILVPLVPTTPFLLLAAACYIRGSKSLYNWLINHRLFGAYIKSYREGKGISSKLKIVLIVLIWITIPLSAILIIEERSIQVSLFAIAVIVSILVLYLPTHDANAVDSEDNGDNTGV
jgi:uncharacterized membrane protein YbaN (DUF454 family)